MGINKKTIGVVSISLIFAVGLGIAIGSSVKMDLMYTEDSNNNTVPVTDHVGITNQSLEELSTSLSNIMLPEAEYTRLSAAIYQTAMGLLAANAQSSGVNIGDATEQELKKSIDEKYSRKYFSDMNANSMKELSKNDLISIISFYNTEAGQKFLALSPKIIQSTMTTVQEDLSSWLPKTVDSIVLKLKDKKTGAKS